MLRRSMTAIRSTLLAALLAAGVPAGIAAQQTGQIAGRVRHADSAEPLPSVQVYVQGTNRGALSTAEGNFIILQVPAGTHTLIAERIGFVAVRQEVTVTAGGNTVVELTLAPTRLQLQEIVVTGLVDPTAGVRSPIAVARLDREMMPVTVSGGAVQNIQGRVAGARMNQQSGQPGTDVSIVLRTPTSLRGDTYPLVVVDGVILGGSGPAGNGPPSTVDIDSQDIESIEVIRGAAASSLYGSRAASGVISITTKRGRDMDVGQTRFTVRSEIGVSQNMRNIQLADHHPYYMNEAQTAYINPATGLEVPRSQRVLPPVSVAVFDKPFPDPIYNNVAAATRPGAFQNNYFQMMGNTASTNFAVSLTNFVERGSLRNNDGYERNAFRVNLDHRLGNTVDLGVSAYHSRDWRDIISTAGNPSGNPFDVALAAPRDVDISRRDDSGQYLQQPDPEVAYQNPLWTQATRDFTSKGTRTLANVRMDWRPLNAISVSGSVGYDRDDNAQREYVPKGTPANVGSAGELDGEIEFNDQVRDTWNAEGQLTFRRDVGLLSVRTTARALLERSQTFSGERSGENFILFGVPQLSNVRDIDRDASSTEREIKALGYLWDTALDYDGRYIFTVLGRRDGSSLFGKDSRWANYYRVAGAWRIAEESWFNVPNITELKLSFARGTAGGRPQFEHQYETWALSGGIPTKTTLGNTELKPEHTLEHEASLNLILNDRIGIVLTHARQKTTDLLNPGPLPAITGYTSQWQNTGTIEGHSTEFELEAQFIRSPRFTWTGAVVADYSNARITEWNIQCYSLSWLWQCKDAPVYGLYSRWLVKNHSSLNQHDGGALVPYANQFQVNDEGFLVWVGEGNNYWEGWDKSLWGTETIINGWTYKWGHPFYELTPEGTAHRTLLGEGTPLNLGFVNSFQIGALNLNAHVSGAIGGAAYNRRHQFLGRNTPATAPRLDQSGKPDQLKKPLDYYRSAEGGDSSYDTEDASYLKLRTVSASYRMDRERLQRFGLGRLGLYDVTVGAVVRNVFILTNYEGWDPEFALNLNNRTNNDVGGYPPTRALTLEVAVTF
jgi:TonB-linked SusC/RagA family outer membrane protein